ncbi:phosphoribosyltransferase family protein [Flavobacterium sp. CS20]|jgi:pyrimidine operon attenuation protein/uracil phosphoribosyltransferase|uniref:phosphoribosyltransferase family protein n=1 Tax=Flavobacterium sp. CS20 TaxID=2775246 RepID=UPI001B39E914|nr:phosphoribosyltransferase family protein [Flavobacterium sp. CS20]QTY25940.1 phosphoribosyltransferase [Flavobacterium sp. CS20]
MNKGTLILNDKQIQHKIKRIAFQVLEFYDGKEDLVIAGIAENGYIFAQKLVDQIKTISDIKPLLCEIKIDKKHPQIQPEISLNKSDYQDKSLVLVDDVLNTGTTLIYTVKHLLDVNLKELKTAVLVDRSHKKFPIKADYKGISLSTSLNETVIVNFGKTSTAELV